MDVLFLSAIILLACVISSKVLYKYGIPTLVIFLTIGMIMGSDGLGGIYFNNTDLAQMLCNIGLIFIMFCGGFGTNWKTARPVAVPAGVLATLGVVLTAFAIGIFAYIALGFSFIEGMLIGSIVSSTDAAAVLSILRSKKLNLREGLIPMLEMESQSNDPMAYMLTITFLGLATGEVKNVLTLLILQIVVGITVGIIVGKASVWLINRINLDIDGLYSIIVIAIALLSFSGANLISGNGFLAVYITGLIMGNCRLIHKVSLIRYFDGISWLMQILLFFTLGVLSFPSQLPEITFIGIGLAAYIIFVARPLAVFITLALFKKSIKEKMLISWVGFRGAASIVFATYPLNKDLPVADTIFNIVFLVAIVSVLIQGTFFIPIAKKLNLIDEEKLEQREMRDYSGELYAEMLEIKIIEGSPFSNKIIMDLNLPLDVVVVTIRRGDRMIAPKDNTTIMPGDVVMFAGNPRILMEIEENAGKLV